MASNRRSARQARRTGRQSPTLDEQLEAQLAERSRLRAINAALTEQLNDLIQKTNHAVDYNIALKARIQTLSAQVEVMEEVAGLVLANIPNIPFESVIDTVEKLMATLRNPPVQDEQQVDLPVEANSSNHSSQDARLQTGLAVDIIGATTDSNVLELGLQKNMASNHMQKRV